MLLQIITKQQILKLNSLSDEFFLPFADIVYICTKTYAAMVLHQRIPGTLNLSNTTPKYTHNMIFLFSNLTLRRF